MEVEYANTCDDLMKENPKDTNTFELLTVGIDAAILPVMSFFWSFHLCGTAF